MRRATGGRRALPGFLIVGAQRAGTTSLFRYLMKHPYVAPAARKEVHFFDLNHDRGEQWYRAHFAPESSLEAFAAMYGVRPAVGEASPYYLFHPLAGERAATMIPELRVIVLLRDPVSRAYSHYQHMRSCGFEHLPFEAALAAEPGRLRGEEARLRTDPLYRSFAHQHHSYVTRGRYLPQLERWFAHVPPDRVLVVVAEDLYADTDAEFLRVTRFLGLPDVSLSTYEQANSHRYPPMSPETKARLQAVFEDENEQLAERLGRPLPWGAARRAAAS